jgi:hypothetical protein
MIQSDISFWMFRSSWCPLSSSHTDEWKWNQKYSPESRHRTHTPVCGSRVGGVCKLDWSLNDHHKVVSGSSQTFI